MITLGLRGAHPAFKVRPLSEILRSLRFDCDCIDKDITRLESTHPELVNRLKYLLGALYDVRDLLETLPPGTMPP